MYSVSSDKNCTAKIRVFIAKNSTEENLLGIKFNSSLLFENKESRKLRAVYNTLYRVK